MTKNTYRLGINEFDTWKEVRLHCRHLLSQGDRELTGDDKLFFFALVDYHPWGHIRQKYGIREVRVGTSEYGKGKCFKIQNNKGDWMDFSYKKCVAGAKGDPQVRKRARASIASNRLLKAYRAAVEHQTLEFRQNSHGGVCDLCGARDSLAVDHAGLPLVQLVKDFEKILGDRQAPPVKSDSDKINAVSFCTETAWGKEFVKVWQGYHRDNSKLRMLCNKCNSSLGSGGIRYTTT